MMIILGSLETA